MEGLTMMVEGALPDPGDKTSHGWSAAPVKVSDPPPVLVMLTGAGLGPEAPACAAKLKLAGLTASTGATGFTVKVANALLLGSACGGHVDPGS